MYVKGSNISFQFVDASKHSVKVEPLKLPTERSLVAAEQINKFWSPSLACGLSTPPPTSGTQTMELPSSGQTHSQLAVPGNNIVNSEVRRRSSQARDPP